MSIRGQILPPSSSGDALAMTISVLEALDTASDAISTAIPLFGIIVSSVLGVAKMLEVRNLSLVFVGILFITP